MKRIGGEGRRTFAARIDHPRFDLLGSPADCAEDVSRVQTWNTASIGVCDRKRFIPGDLRVLKELDDVAGGVDADDLLASLVLHNVVSELHALFLEL